MFGQVKNYSPYSHNSRFGTQFKSERCDLACVVKVIKPSGISDIQFMSDVSEFIGYHSCVIREDLNGFRGYDCIDYEVTIQPADDEEEN